VGGLEEQCIGRESQGFRHSVRRKFDYIGTKYTLPLISGALPSLSALWKIEVKGFGTVIPEITLVS
jgi:hypothetical protein